MFRESFFKVLGWVCSEDDGYIGFFWCWGLQTFLRIRIGTKKADCLCSSIWCFVHGFQWGYLTKLRPLPQCCINLMIIRNRLYVHLYIFSFEKLIVEQRYFMGLTCFCLAKSRDSFKCRRELTLRLIELCTYFSGLPSSLWTAKVVHG